MKFLRKPATTRGRSYLGVGLRFAAVKLWRAAVSGPSPWLGPARPSQFFLAPSRRLGTPSTGTSRGWPLYCPPAVQASTVQVVANFFFFPSVRAGDRSLGWWPFCRTSWRFEMEDAPQAGRRYSIGDVISCACGSCTLNMGLFSFGRNWYGGRWSIMSQERAEWLNDGWQCNATQRNATAQREGGKRGQQIALFVSICVDTAVFLAWG